LEARLAAGLKVLEQQDQSTVAAVEGRLGELEGRLAADLRTLEQQDQSTIAAVEGRLGELEGRLAADLKVLEQQDQTTAAAVEGRLGELEARLASGLKTLERKDQTAAASVEGRLREVQGQCNSQVTALRDTVAKEMEARIAAVEAHLRGEVLEAADRSSTQAASASSAQLGEQLAPVQSALAEKDREIAELRRRLVDNEETVLELVLALGRMRRHKGARQSNAEAAETPPHEDPPADDGGPSAGAPTDPPAASGPPAPPPTGGKLAPFQAVAATPSKADRKGHSHMEPTPIAQAHDASRWWHIPLVSSLPMLAAGSLWLLAASR
jgi:uncharacterized coiled-coil protein SlyX